MPADINTPLTERVLAAFEPTDDPAERTLSHAAQGRVAFVMSKGAARAITVLAKEVQALRTELLRLNADAMKFMGPFRAGEVYRPGSVVQARGALWMVKAGHVTSLPPGDAEGAQAGWVMVQKSPRQDR
jgi:hypothetical protein